MTDYPRSTMNRRRFASGAAAAFAGVAIVRAPARAAQFNFKVGYPLPQGHPQHIRMVEAAARILTSTNGRLQLQLFPNSELGSDDSSVAQLRSGAMEMYIGSDGVLSTIVMDAAIKTVDDLAGLKVRTPGAKLYVDMFKTLGAAPTPVNVADVYTALQTKVIDSVEVPMAIIEASKWYEPTKYLSITNHIWGNLFAVVNLDAWKSLPPDIAAILNREIDRAGMLEREDMLHADAALRTKLQGQGLTVNEVADLAPFRAKLRPFYTDMKSAFSPKKRPAA